MCVLTLCQEDKSVSLFCDVAFSICTPLSSLCDMCAFHLFAQLKVQEGNYSTDQTARIGRLIFTVVYAHLSASSVS